MTTTALGQVPTSQDLLNKCDAALNARGEQVRICEQRVLLRDQEIERLLKSNVELRKQTEPGFFDNPVVIGALGVVLGVWIGSRITR